jgi:hypothetical protein
MRCLIVMPSSFFVVWNKQVVRPITEFALQRAPALVFAEHRAIMHTLRRRMT